MATMKWLGERASSIHIDGHECVCVNCKHFIQHYVLFDEQYMVPTSAGHCGVPRMRNKCAADTCKHFERREDAAKTSGFVRLVNYDLWEGQ